MNLYHLFFCAKQDRIATTNNASSCKIVVTCNDGKQEFKMF